jgi:5'-3' exonuclease
MNAATLANKAQGLEYAEPLYLLDASVFFFKAYFLEAPFIADDKGRDISAVMQFSKTLLRFLQKEQPTYIAAAFDESLFTGFRHQLSPSYKANRALPDEALAYQLHLAKSLVEALGIKAFACNLYEADDYIASLARFRCKQPDQPSVIARPLVVLSNDKDLGQLLSCDTDCLYDYSKNQRFYKADIEQKFSVGSEQIADYLALAGDSIDGIAGVKGVGAKTAVALLQRFTNIEQLLENLDENNAVLENLPVRGAKSLAAKIKSSEKQLRQDLQLTQLVCDIEIPVTSVDELQRGEIYQAFFENDYFKPLTKWLENK